MSFDWTTALNAQDQSLESTLARKDMSRQNQQLMGVVRQAEEQRQNQAQEQQRQQALQQQAADRAEAQKWREQQAIEIKRKADEDDARARYGVMMQGQKPGQRRPQTFLQENAKFVNPSDYEADPQDPNQAIYLRQEAERIEAVQKAAEAEKKAAAQRAKEDQQRQQRDEQRKDRDEQRQIAKGKEAQATKVKDISVLTNYEKVRLKSLAAKIIQETATPASENWAGLTTPAEPTITEAEAEERAMEQIFTERKAMGQPVPQGAKPVAPKKLEYGELAKKYLK